MLDRDHSADLGLLCLCSRCCLLLLVAGDAPSSTVAHAIAFIKSQVTGQVSDPSERKERNKAHAKASLQKACLRDADACSAPSALLPVSHRRSPWPKQRMATALQTRASTHPLSSSLSPDARASDRQRRSNASILFSLFFTARQLASTERLPFVRSRAAHTSLALPLLSSLLPFFASEQAANFSIEHKSRRVFAESECKSKRVRVCSSERQLTGARARKLSRVHSCARPDRAPVDS